jgi:secondary thiamine-phosphate synthase enzyme
MRLEHGKNAYAHILSSLIKPNLQIPIIEGHIPLGRWQKILFIELDGPRKRTIHAALIG